MGVHGSLSNRSSLIAFILSLAFSYTPQFFFETRKRKCKQDTSKMPVSITVRQPRVSSLESRDNVRGRASRRGGGAPERDDVSSSKPVTAGMHIAHCIWIRGESTAHDELLSETYRRLIRGWGPACLLSCGLRLRSQRQRYDSRRGAIGSSLFRGSRGRT